MSALAEVDSIMHKLGEQQFDNIFGCKSAPKLNCIPGKLFSTNQRYILDYTDDKTKVCIWEIRDRYNDSDGTSKLYNNKFYTQKILSLNEKATFEFFDEVGIVSKHPHNLSLHFSLIKSVNGIDWLISKETSAETITKLTHELILVSCQVGDLDKLKSIVDSFKKLQSISPFFDYYNINIRNTFDIVCRNNYLELAQYIFDLAAEYQIEIDLNYSVNNALFDEICAHGYLEMAIWLNTKCNYFEKGLHSRDKLFKMACQNGHFHVIEWFNQQITKRYGYTYFYSTYLIKESMRIICQNKHFDTLQSLIKMLIETVPNNLLECKEDILGKICASNQVELAKWFVTEASEKTVVTFKFCYFYDQLEACCLYKSFDGAKYLITISSIAFVHPVDIFSNYERIFKCIKKAGQTDFSRSLLTQLYHRIVADSTKKEFQLSKKIASEMILFASAQGSIDILDAWLIDDRKQKSVFKFNEESIRVAGINSQFEVLEWFANSFKNLKFECLSQVLERASADGRVDILDKWFAAYRTTFIISSNAIVLATENNHVEVLYWWSTKCIVKEFVKNYQTLKTAFKNKSYGAIRWWKESVTDVYEEWIWHKIQSIRTEHQIESASMCRKLIEFELSKER